MKSVLSVLCFVVAAGIAVGRTESPKTPRVTVEVGMAGAVLVKGVLPTYPVAMIRRGIEGVVELEVLVNAQGIVVGITTVSATNGTFVTPARNAAWQWQFATSEQLPSDECVRYRVPVQFRLWRS